MAPLSCASVTDLYGSNFGMNPEQIVQQTLKNMGFESLKSLRQGKHFEIEIEEKDRTKAKIEVEKMCKKLLVNEIIEDYTIELI